MTTAQKAIKYLAIAFAVFLIISIAYGVLNAAGVIIGVFEKDGVAEDITVYPVSSEITALELEIGAADLSIVAADRFSVESNLKYLTVNEKDGTLVIKEQKMSGVSYNNAVLTLYIPKDTVLTRASVVTGAGRLRVDVLSAGQLKLLLGAGAVEINELNAQESAEVEGGAGEITIHQGSLNDLKLEMGVGQLNLSAALYGDSILELGVGETNLTVLQPKDLYRVEIEKGIGSITIDGETIGKNTSIGDGENRIEINGGIGAINLRFDAN